MKTKINKTKIIWSRQNLNFLSKLNKMVYINLSTMRICLLCAHLNLNFMSDLLFMVFKTGQRVDFNTNNICVLIVGEIYSLDSDEIWVPLWATLYSLPKIPVMYPWPIRPRGPKKLTRSPGSYGKSPPNVEGALCAWVWLIPDFSLFKLRANFELSLSCTW